MSLLPATLAFGETPLTLIDRQGEPWVTRTDLARALYGIQGGGQTDAPLLNAIKALAACRTFRRQRPIGHFLINFCALTRNLHGIYDPNGIGFCIGRRRRLKSDRLLDRLFQRHADEFTDQMTALVDMETPGGRQKVRIFSPRGCHLIAMFSRTERAKVFRRWVLDVLERHIRGSGPECRLMPLLALTHGRWGHTLRPGGYNAISLNTAQVFAYLLEQYGDGAWHEVSQRQLSAEVGIPRSSLVKVLDGLEAWGLLRRREGGPGESGQIRLLMGRIRREMKRVEFPLPVKPAGLLH